MDGGYDLYNRSWVLKVSTFWFLIYLEEEDMLVLNGYRFIEVVLEFNAR